MNDDIFIDGGLSTYEGMMSSDPKVRKKAKENRLYELALVNAMLRKELEIAKGQRQGESFDAFCIRSGARTKNEEIIKQANRIKELEKQLSEALEKINNLESL